MPTKGNRHLADYLVYELSFVQVSVSEGYYTTVVSQNLKPMPHQQKQTDSVQ